MEPRCTSENFHGAGRFQPFGQTFSNGTLRIPRNVCWAENALLIARQSQSGRPLAPAVISRLAAYLFFSRARSLHTRPFFAISIHLLLTPHHSSSSFPSSVFFSSFSSLSLFLLFHFPPFFAHSFPKFLFPLFSPPSFPFPLFYFSFFNKNSHVCAFEVRSQSATRAHPLLVSHPLPLVAFLVVEPPFPRFRSFQKYHRHPFPSSFPSRQEFQRANFAVRNLRHRRPVRPPTLFSTSTWKGEERSLASPPLLMDYSAVSKHRFELFIE